MRLKLFCHFKHILCCSRPTGIWLYGCATKRFARVGSAQPQDDKPKFKFLHKVNHKITAESVQLIDETQTNIGQVPLGEALERAKSAGLDLVEVSKPKKETDIPVCRIISYKELWEKTVKSKQKAPKKKKFVKKGKSKTMTFTTSAHQFDVDRKIAQIKQFLDKGLIVNVEVRRKRNQSDIEGGNVLEYIEKELELVSTEIDRKQSAHFARLELVKVTNAELAEKTRQRSLKLEKQLNSREDISNKPAS